MTFNGRQHAHTGVSHKAIPPGRRPRRKPPYSYPRNPQSTKNQQLKVVLPGRFELPFAASETAALSIELREQRKDVERFATTDPRSTRKAFDLARLRITRRATGGETNYRDCTQ